MQLAPPARAQRTGAGDLVPPRVFFVTSSGTSFTGATAPNAPVEVHVCEETALNEGSLTVTLNGTNVSSQLGQQGVAASECPTQQSLVMKGSVGPLAEGTSTLSVHVCDQGLGADGNTYTPNCVNATKTFTYAYSGPTVLSVSPNGGPFDAASVPVTIAWKAGASPINANTGVYKVNGVMNSTFVYNAASLTSTGTVQLMPGSNVLKVNICDTSGLCSHPVDAGATFVRASSTPAITVTPAGARTPDSLVSVSVSVQLGINQLARSTVSFTVNGVATTAFQQAATPAPPSGGDRQDYAGTLKLVPGDNVVSVRACSVYGSCATQEATYFRYTAYHAAPVARAAFADDRYAPPAMDLSLSVSGPHYTSMDVDRTLRFVYHSSSVNPLAVVQLDASDYSSDKASSMSLRLLDANGARVGFTDGSTEVVYAGGNGTQRLAGQFAAGGLATGAYTYTAVVTSFFRDGSTAQASLPVRILVVNELRSVEGFFPGWTMLGLAHAYTQVGGGLVVTEGDGSAVLFGLAGCKDANGSPIYWAQPTTETCTYTSPVGDFSTMAYSRSAGTITRTFPDGSRVVFNLMGYQTAVIDRFQRRTSYVFDGVSRHTAIDDPTGTRTTLGYNGSRVLGAVTGPTGENTYFYYAAVDLNDIATLTGAAFTPPQEPRDQLYYDASGGFVLDWMQGPTTVAASPMLPTFDHTGTLTQLSTPVVNTTAGQVRQVTRQRSAVSLLVPTSPTSLSAPAPRIVPSEAWASVTAANGDSVRLLTDRWGLPTKVVDSRGKVSTAVRDSIGRLVMGAGPSGDTTRVEWDLYRVSKVTGSGGDVTQYFYQNLTFPALATTVYNPDNSITSNYFGAAGQLDSTRYGPPDTRETTRVAYDALFRPIRTATVRLPSHDSVVTTMTYQPTGLRNLATAASKTGTTTYGYDPRGLVKTVTDPLANVSTLTYDASGRVKTAADAAGNTTGYTYLGEAEGPAWAYGFGVVNTVTDPLGQRFSVARNAVGWVDTDTDPRGQVRRFTYGVDGQVASVQNRDGSLDSLGYDTRGRLARRKAGNSVTTWQYDDDGRWVIVQNAASTDTLRYDAQGRLTSETTVRGGRAYRIGSTYDGAGQRRSVTSQRLDTGGAPETLATYGYDYGALRTVQPAGSAADTVKLGYDGGNLSTLDYPGGIRGTYRYTTTGGLSEITYTGTNGQAVNDAAGEHYGYDLVGRLSRRQSNALDSARAYNYGANGWVSSYGRAPQSLAGCHPDPDLGTNCQPTFTWKSYTYDANGNRSDNGAVRDVGNRLLQFKSYVYSYDVEGRVTHRSIAGMFDQWIFYNVMGQVDSLSTEGSLDGRWVAKTMTRYAYDGLGRRIRKSSSDGKVTEYVYDGSDIVLELDASGSPVARYTSLPGVDATLSVERGGSRYYYLSDYQGSVSAVVSRTGAVADRYRYDPWGAAEATTETVAQPYRYTGREYDAESGLYYYRARYYDAPAGRFLSEDPIGINGGLNLFEYAGNDPVNATDPSGMDPCPIHVKRYDPFTQQVVDVCVLPGLDVKISRSQTAVERARENPFVSSRGSFSLAPAQFGGASNDFMNQASAKDVVPPPLPQPETARERQARVDRYWSCVNSVSAGIMMDQDVDIRAVLQGTMQGYAQTDSWRGGVGNGLGMALPLSQLKQAWNARVEAGGLCAHYLN